MVSISLDLDQIPRGPGYFKLNNSLLLDTSYQTIIKRSISETALINIDSNPNTLWEIIKGNIRNETIRYATIKNVKILKGKKN